MSAALQDVATALSFLCSTIGECLIIVFAGMFLIKEVKKLMRPSKSLATWIDALYRGKNMEYEVPDELYNAVVSVESRDSVINRINRAIILRILKTAIKWIAENGPRPTERETAKVSQFPVMQIGAIVDWWLRTMFEKKEPEIRQHVQHIAAQLVGTVLRPEESEFLIKTVEMMRRKS